MMAALLWNEAASSKAVKTIPMKPKYSSNHLTQDKETKPGSVLVCIVRTHPLLSKTPESPDSKHHENPQCLQPTAKAKTYWTAVWQKHAVRSPPVPRALTKAQLSPHSTFLPRQHRHPERRAHSCERVRAQGTGPGRTPASTTNSSPTRRTPGPHHTAHHSTVVN